MKVRETEIELLRIVIMILIIITHLAVWGTAKTENATILQQTTAEITNAIIRWHVNVFVIITGYFGIKSRKSMLNIIIMSVFYTWFLYGLQCIFCGYNFSILRIVKSLFFITHTLPVSRKTTPSRGILNIIFLYSRSTHPCSRSPDFSSTGRPYSLPPWERNRRNQILFSNRY